MAAEPPLSSASIPTDPTPAPPAPAAEPSKPTQSDPTLPVQRGGLQYRVVRHLAFQARRLDRLIIRLSALLSNPAATDALLGTLSYTLELLRALLSRLLTHRLTKIASTIAEKADNVLLPGETLIAELPTPRSDQVLAQVAAGSKALATVISDYRIFVRLWALASYYMWVRSTWNAPLAQDASTKDKLVRRITWAEIASLVTFQVLENGAYLASKGVLTSEGWSGEAGKRREGKWWVWSCRFWAAAVALEIVRVGVLACYEDRKTDTKEKEVVGDGEKEGKLLVEQKKRENWLWWKDAVSNVAYMPMTLHWSVEEGLLSDWAVGILGMVACGSSFVDAWMKTA